MAHVVARVRATPGAALPLAAGASMKRYKLILADTGLFQRIAGMREHEWKNETALMNQYLGTVTEQVVGQELLSLDDQDLDTGLFYWDRSEARATAELDYLAAFNGKIVPIEVKSGASGHMKSMFRFLQEHPSYPLGIRLSEKNFGMREKVMNVPLYAIACLPVLAG